MKIENKKVAHTRTLKRLIIEKKKGKRRKHESCWFGTCYIYAKQK